MNREIPLRRTALLVVNCAAMAQHGIILLLLGPVLPSMMDTFQIQPSAAGILLGLGSLGFMLGPMVAGTLADRAGVKGVLVSGFLAEIVFLALMGVSPFFAWAAAANLALHFAAAFVETAVNIVPALIERRHAGSLMNLVHMFFSVGAFIAPFLVGLILQQTGNWRLVFWLAAIPTLALAIYAALIRFPNGRDVTTEGQASQGPAPLRAVLSDRSVLLGALAIGLYVGAEGGASSWIVLYLERTLRFSTLAATSGLSLLWIGIMVGRYLNSILARTWSSRDLVLAAGVGGFVTGLLLLTARGPVTAYVWLTLLGIFMSGVYPNIMAELNSRDPARAGAVTGFLTVGAAAGIMITNPILGAIAQWISLPAAIAMPGVLMGLLAITYLGAVNVRPGERPATAYGVESGIADRR